MGMKNSATAKCPKCDGRGKLDPFRHIDNGKCFCCGGAGSVDVTLPSVRQILVMQANYAISGIEEEQREYGDVRQCEIDKAAKALFDLADTALARTILGNLARRSGPALRAAVIDAGRRMKAEAA